MVQDTASYQKLVDRVERADQLEITRRSIAEMDAGLDRPVEEMLAEMRQILEQKRSR